MQVGYARVSTIDQDTGLQVAALRAAEWRRKVREKKRSGTTTKGRTELETILSFLRPGDVLVVRVLTAWPAPLPTCKRSSAASVTLVRNWPHGSPSTRAPPRAKRSSTCSACSPNSRQTSGASGNSRGSAAAKERGVYRGRPATIKLEAITDLKAQGFGASEIAKQLGIGRASVYRVLGKNS